MWEFVKLFELVWIGMVCGEREEFVRKGEWVCNLCVGGD